MSNAGQAVLDVVGLVLSIYTESPYPLLIAEAAGQVLFPTQLPGVTGPRLTDHLTTTASLGDPIPFGWGTFAVNGTVIWLDIVIEHSQTTTQGGKGGPTQDVTTFSYTQSIGIGLHFGEIIDLLRVWENGELVYDKRPQQIDEPNDDYAKRVQKTGQYAQTFVLYLGTEDQAADPTIELKEGIGNVPPFLGLAYIVYPDRVLRDDQAQRHPQFKFELVTSANRQLSLLGPTYMAGVATGVDEGTIAVDWAHGRFYTISVTGTGSPALMGWTIENNTQFVNSPYTNYPDINPVWALGDAVAVNPYTGDVFFTWAGVPAGGLIIKANPLTLAQEGQTLIHDFYTSMQEVGFGQTTDYTASLVNVMLWVGAVYDNQVATLSCDTMVLGPAITYSGSKVRFCTGRKVGNVLVWWVASWTETLSGTGGTIEWHKITYTPAAGPLDAAIWASNLIATTAPVAFDATWTRITEVTGVTFDSGRQKLLFEVTGFAAGAGSTSYLASVSPTTGAVDWVTAASLISADIGSNSGAVTNNRWYLAAGSFAYEVNTQNGVITPTDLSAELVAAGVGTLEEAYSSNTPVGGGIVSMSNVGPVVLYLAKLVGGDVLVSDIVADICDQSTLTENDVTTMDSTRVHGYVIQTPSVTGRSAITPLRSVAFFDAVEHGESLRFVTRGGAPVVTLTNADLGAYETDTTTDPDANNTSVDTLESDLPMQIRVNYSSVERSYESGEQLSLARYDTDASQVSDVQLPLCLNDSQAAQVAEILWNQAWQRRRTYSFTLDVSKTYLEATDPVLVPLKNTLVRVMLTQIDDSSQILRKVTAISDDDGTYVSSAVAQPAPPQVTMTFYSETALQLIDTPLLRDRDDTGRVTAPLYAAVEPNGVDVWRGAQLYNSTDGTAFTGVVGASNKAAMGRATTLLADADPFVTDETNTLTIQFDDGATLPSSVTTDDVLAGTNAMVLVDAGGTVEIICFRDVTPVSGQTVTVSYLLRGRRGTDTMTDGHAIGGRVVMLTTAALEVSDLDLVRLDTTMYWKAVTFGTATADVASSPFQSSGRSLMPYAPVNIHVLESGSPTVDLEIHAKRRARIGASEWLDGETDDLPLAEDFERYDLDIYSGSSVVRTLTADSLPITYDHADIVTDFGSVPTSLKLALYQISHQVGRGFAKVQTIEVE